MKEMQFDDQGRWYHDISSTAQAMRKQADAHEAKVISVFNGVPIFIVPDENPEEMTRRYMHDFDRRALDHKNSPEVEQRMLELRRKHEEKVAEQTAILGEAPQMSLSDPDAWAHGLALNTDGYGSAVYRYAEKWARIMEARLAAGQTIQECAKSASHLADDEGITGFMYGCAVGILARCWRHGEELRRWHNLDTQIKDEGERANEAGTVLNPALLVIGGK
jgi:hypothetical protein